MEDYPITRKEAEILRLIESYGGIDGSHHKQWILDQIVRIICHSKNDYYLWLQLYEEGEDGPNTYEWDTGIAP